MPQLVTFGTTHVFDGAAFEALSLGQQHVGQLRTVSKTIGFVMARPATAGGYVVLDEQTLEDLRQAQALIFGALARVHRSSTGS